jgi:replicative DNA helicase
VRVNTVELAERASLGALLLEPAQVPAVSAWLRESDFHHPRSRITYRLLTVQAASQTPSVIRGVLAAALADPAARVNGVAGPYLHELLASPGGLGRSAVYGRLVVEASVLRTLHDRALELAHLSALTAQAPDSVELLADAVSRTLGEVQALAGRMREADPSYTDQPAGVVGTKRPSPARAVGPSSLETDAVAGLQDNPGLVPRVSGWLRPDDFASREHAGSYRSMVALAGRGQPVDHVTTQCSRRDRYAPTAQLPAHLVAIRIRATSHETVTLARQVLGVSVARRTLAAAHAITELGDNPTVGSRRRLDTASHHLDLCRQEANRWLTWDPHCRQP